VIGERIGLWRCSTQSCGVGPFCIPIWILDVFNRVVSWYRDAERWRDQGVRDRGRDQARRGRKRWRMKTLPGDILGKQTQVPMWTDMM
jgi:hypothetical protein